MRANCPRCARQFTRAERARLFGGGLWRPRAHACPECGTPLRWALLPWRLQFVGALGVLLALYRGFPGEARAVLAAGGVLLALLAAGALRLRAE